MLDLSVDLGFLNLKNPIIPASGTFGYGEEFAQFFDLNTLGAFVLKGIFNEPREGNPPPRIQETASGLLNSIGLAGPGKEKLKNIILRVNKLSNTPIIVNVCGKDQEEYLEVSQTFDDMPEVSALELNISCPNVKLKGKCIAQDSTATYNLIKTLKKTINKPLIIKLSPNVPDISEVAIAAEEAGGDALSLVNTFLGFAVDLKKQKPVFKNVYAGLSGPAIKPLALRLVYEAAKSVKIPVIGIGGITTGKDVLEYILVGASAVQTGTVNMIDPMATIRILKEIKTEMESLHLTKISDLKGKLKL